MYEIIDEPHVLRPEAYRYRAEASSRGGTLFVDDIGGLSPATQVKVLRLLEEGVFERVGAPNCSRPMCG